MIKILKAIRMTLKKGGNQTLWGPWTNARESKNQGAPVQLHTLQYPKYSTDYDRYQLKFRLFVALASLIHLKGC